MIIFQHFTIYLMKVIIIIINNTMQCFIFSIRLHFQLSLILSLMSFLWEPEWFISLPWGLFLLFYLSFYLWFIFQAIFILSSSFIPEIMGCKVKSQSQQYLAKQQGLEHLFLFDNFPRYSIKFFEQRIGYHLTCGHIFFIQPKL